MDAYQTELCWYMCKRCPCHVFGEEPTLSCRGTSTGMCSGAYSSALTYSEVCGELGEGWHGTPSGPGGPGGPGIPNPPDWDDRCAHGTCGQIHPSNKFALT